MQSAGFDLPLQGGDMTWAAVLQDVRMMKFEDGHLQTPGAYAQCSSISKVAGRKNKGLAAALH